MKKLRILLSVFALVLAVGGTFASTTESTPVNTGYEYIQLLNKCTMVSTTCGQFEGALCTSGSGNKIGSVNDVSTQCGPQLRFP